MVSPYRPVERSHQASRAFSVFSEESRKEADALLDDAVSRDGQLPSTLVLDSADDGVFDWLTGRLTSTPSQCVSVGARLTRDLELLALACPCEVAGAGDAGVTALGLFWLVSGVCES
jgi:hypothetical protein